MRSASPGLVGRGWAARTPHLGGRRGGATQSRSTSEQTTGASYNNATTITAPGAGFSLGWKRSILRKNFTLVQKKKSYSCFI